MARWPELQERIREAFTLDRDDPDEFALTIERPSEHGSRAQRVIVRRYEAWGHEMCELRSAFGELGDTPAADILADSLGLPLGSIALHGRFMVLVHKCCLEHQTIEGILFVLTRMTLLADVLEQRSGGDRF